MKTIMRIKFGSHLYGTATPESDFDFKSVYIPDGADILLGRIKGSVSTKRPKQDGEKNYAGEEDEEAYSLDKFLALVSQGQTVAMDMLFAPNWAHTQFPSPEWKEIIENRHRLLTKRSTAFVGYCRTQANKYGIKGSRVSAARSALAVLWYCLSLYGSQEKLGIASDKLRRFAEDVPHVSIEFIDQMDGSKHEFLNVCGRRLSFRSSIKNAHDIVSRMLNEYGKRALQAESNEGVDWKALSHAVRIADQAVDLLTTGHVTFPCQNVQHILDIKLALVPYQDVAKEIEDRLDDVEAVALTSHLQDNVDAAWIDDFIIRSYGRAVMDM